MIQTCNLLLASNLRCEAVYLRPDKICLAHLPPTRASFCISVALQTFLSQYPFISSYPCSTTSPIVPIPTLLLQILQPPSSSLNLRIKFLPPHLKPTHTFSPSFHPPPSFKMISKLTLLTRPRHRINRQTLITTLRPSSRLLAESWSRWVASSFHPSTPHPLLLALFLF